MFFRSTIVLTFKQFQELQEGLEKSGDAEALELMLIDHDTELGFYLHHAAAIQFFAGHA